MDTMTVKPASGKSTTIYEVDDSNIGGTKFDSESRHYKPFYDFIASLGFDVKETHEGAHLDSHMTIDGESFHVDFSKSPVLAYMPYGRKYVDRKDRCIELRDSSGYKSSLVAKVKFNEEIDRDKLVAKIQKAIEAKKKWKQELVDRKNNELRLLTEMRDLYYANRIISAYVDYIFVEKGKITFSINGANIVLDASSGIPSDFVPYEKRDDGSIKVANIVKWACEKKDIADKAVKVCKAIVETGKPSREFAEYAKEAHHKYVRKNRIEE